MKLDEVILGPGRPIAYYPRLREIAVSTNAAILLCQLIYWTGKQRDPEGWIQKRIERAPDDAEGILDPCNQSIEVETGLTYWEQAEARRLLRKRGFLQERARRPDHRVFFRLDLGEIQNAWQPREPGWPTSEAADTNQGNRDCQPRNPRLTTSESEDVNQPNRDSIKGTNRDYAESTTEKGATNSMTKELPSSWNLAHGLPVSDEQLEREREGDLATAEFESALGVENWPWASTRAWEKLVALVTSAWKEEPQIFRQYAEWAEGEGRFKAMTVKQIRLSPQQFIDTGWPLFLSSRRRKEEPMVQEETELERWIRQQEATK